MPYIISTTSGERYGDGYPGTTFFPLVTRRAVATLAEVVSTLNATGADWTLSGANGEGGGTVGPLPDGSVIEVERVSGYALAQRTIARGRVIGLDPRSPNAEKQRLILDAYNAAQA